MRNVVVLGLVPKRRRLRMAVHGVATGVLVPLPAAASDQGRLDRRSLSVTAEQPDGAGHLPSEDLTWDDLDEALLVVIVAPDGEVRVWTEDGTAAPQHAAHLRAIANRIDPPTTPHPDAASEAAALWGIAENLAFPAKDRLAAALKALEFYGDDE